MSIDLSSLSPGELEKLAREIEARKAEVAKQALKKAYADMLEVAKKHGVSFDEVIALHSGKGSKTAPKYANPADPTQTWSGRGRKPAWFIDALAAGKTPEDLEI
ncbi:H-NS histone family protein [Pseudoruegeria aquimaris]|uniref:H-NS histone family protein n=1 Tax=Pseudoruegeria aquimaris TaxID=393663 RepID=A0A1Y5R7I7_9RHOB|nr:H-NS histone family protein [Pseudoruegeria aquimaris]SLN10314.1 H-NS histone family protein [Pseudoruegeria aquimaris]